MSNTNQLAALKSALTLAFAQGSTLMGSYLDNLGVYDYAVLTVLWQELGLGDDSILSFAEKVRRA
jgi:type IV secretory pathway VirB10-like protein